WSRDRRTRGKCSSRNDPRAECAPRRTDRRNRFAIRLVFRELRARPMELERPTDADRERSSRVRVGAGDEGVVEREDIQLRKRVGQAPASLEVVVPQEAIMLKQAL